jgi:hypothetical protein
MSTAWNAIVRWTALSAAACFVVVAACSEDTTSAASGAQDFGSTVSDLGEWNGALPDTTAVPPVPLPNSVLTAANGDAWVCQNSEHELKKNFNSFLAPGMTSGVLWPGALIQGATLIAGTPAPITLPRSPIAISIDLAVPDPSRQVDVPTSATVQDAVASLQREADSRLGDIDVVPARVDFSMSEANATFQFMMDLGVYAKGSAPAAMLGLEVPGTVSIGVDENLSANSSFQRHTIAVKLLQPMYTISFADEAMREPVDYLDPSVTDAEVQQAVDRGVLGPDNLPTYVKSVTYGRMITYTMTNTFAAEATELKAATQAAFNLFKVGSASVGDSLTTRQQLILSNSEVKVLAFGGSQESALDAIRTGQLDKFFTPVPATQAVPLGYRVNYLKNSRVATLGLGTKYTQSQCTAAPGTQSRYWHVLMQSMTSNGGCTGPSYDREAVLTYTTYYHDALGTKISSRATYPLYVDSVGPMKDTTVNREVVVQVPPVPNSSDSLKLQVTSSLFVPVTNDSPLCGFGSMSITDCQKVKTFLGNEQLAVSPYEFNHIITLPGDNSACTVTFNYQVFLQPVLLREGGSVVLR